MNDADSVTIWRYMDLAKFICLLEHGLFFALPTTFQDEWEGAWAELDVRKFREERMGMSTEQTQSEWDVRYQRKARHLNKYGISAWHRSEDESEALWKLYAPIGMGVAIKSSVSRVYDALPSAERQIECHEIKYGSYEDISLGDDAVNLLTFKRRHFEHEKELRFITQLRHDELGWAEIMRNVFRHGESRHVTARVIQPLITPFGGFSSKDPTVSSRVLHDGVYLQTDINTLIEAVYVVPKAPPALRGAVHAIMKAFDLDTKLLEYTSLDQIPYDKIIFHNPN